MRTGNTYSCDVLISEGKVAECERFVVEICERYKIKHWGILRKEQLGVRYWVAGKNRKYLERAVQEMDYWDNGVAARRIKIEHRIY